MVEPDQIFEITLRGASAGVSFFLALILMIGRERTKTQLLAALFSLSVGVYALISGDATAQLLGALVQPAIIIAIWGTVFFWWFGAALFDDDFKWRWWRFAPFAVLPTIYLLRQILAPGGVSSSLLYIHLSLNALLFADVFRIAVTHAADDLVLQRRRFRVAFALIVGLYGIGIAIAEIVEVSTLLPDLLKTFHVVVVFGLNVLFGAWLLSVRPGLFAAAPGAEPAGAAHERQNVGAADRPLHDKLMALMDAGVYREEGLSVVSLAEKVGVPEHQLRKLINGMLGFRNFSAFLNERRIADAKTMLGDPANARKQVIQTALDLGYGSIAPFNRAFKQATGKTPTQYRKEMLGDV